MVGGGGGGGKTMCMCVGGGWWLNHCCMQLCQVSGRLSNVVRDMDPEV